MRSPRIFLVAVVVCVVACMYLASAQGRLGPDPSLAEPRFTREIDYDSPRMRRSSARRRRFEVPDMMGPYVEGPCPCADCSCVDCQPMFRPDEGRRRRRRRYALRDDVDTCCGGRDPACPTCHGDFAEYTRWRDRRLGHAPRVRSRNYRADLDDEFRRAPRRSYPASSLPLRNRLRLNESSFEEEGCRNCA